MLPWRQGGAHCSKQTVRGDKKERLFLFLMEVAPSDIDIGRGLNLFSNVSSLGFPPKAITRRAGGERSKRRP